ncbi:metal-dependent hydrolase [Natrinema salsiterrestre]|uniref:Metal-dependent hydrolase n=1 Tax=Natrinema salsiterrestre TaxID=2950540 RepID=A0A9Q4PZH7_9EURY|nr:metal-dependent hydrolase [Natrinema salsiterrestre]MDF9744239.1 metal-dependent hydrolase [Natrinema salsiterrestre]
MVADGVHILFSLALVLLLFRSNRPEPYLVTALAAAFPDIDIVLFPLLADFGYEAGVLWSHRALTHSLLAGVVVVGLLSVFGPWRAAAVGFGSHILMDLLSGGVRLFAPLDATLYGLSIDWLLLNMLTSVFAVTVLLGGLFGMKYDFGPRGYPRSPRAALERFR